MTEQEYLHEESRKRILSLRLFDDDFMNACFGDYIEGMQLVVRIILGRDDFQVVSVKTQTLLKNYYPELAKRVRYFKETEEGEHAMNSVLEEWKNEELERERIEIALRMLADGIPLEKVVQYSGLPLEKVQELASKDIA